jgi:hypothetical protein
MITRRFINGVIRDGRLTEARKRHEEGTAKPAGWNFGSQSCWSLVCEEIIDTDHEPEGYDAVYAELVRRGFSPAEIDEMRRFAWRTAGWMNYDLILWDWVNLDEGDIRRALDLQLEMRKIKRPEYDDDLATLQHFLDRDPPLKIEPQTQGMEGLGYSAEKDS